MKIPESAANVEAYYSNEENGQWQNNGVGADGSGDATRSRFRHQGHQGGTGAMGASSDDFADYLWMEHEEEFDKQVLQQLEEEALMEQCVQAMLDDERRERRRARGSETAPPLRSSLNPLAAEFVPTLARRPPQPEGPAPPPQGPAPAARPKGDSDKQTAPKQEAKFKTKPPPAKAELKPSAPNAAPAVTSGPADAPVVSTAVSTATSTAVAPAAKGESETATAGAEDKAREREPAPKPINYAAAAKANKPRKGPASAPASVPAAAPAPAPGKRAPAPPRKSSAK